MKKKGKVTVLNNVILTDVKESDSGIDANSQGNCSSTDAKNAVAATTAAATRVVSQSQNSTPNKKEKKKKGKEVTVEDKTIPLSSNIKLTTDSAATQTNTKLNISQTKTIKVSLCYKFCAYILKKIISLT